MKIVLQPMPQPPKGVCIGTLDGEPLTVLGRVYLAGGRELSHDEVGSALVDAVDEAATKVLGHEWVTSLARLMQLNKRSTSRDRVAKFGLPDYVLAHLAQMAAHPQPRALGHALLCVEAIQGEHTTASHASGRPAMVDVIERNEAASKTLRRALFVLDEVLDEREAFRRKKEALDAAFQYEDSHRPVTKD